VTTAAIGELVLQHLKKLDKIAYVRFASVYRDFQDAESFLTELKELFGGGKYRFVGLLTVTRSYQKHLLK
jgi:transcriptional regulator NrdR family protein